MPPRYVEVRGPRLRRPESSGTDAPRGHLSSEHGRRRDVCSGNRCARAAVFPTQIHAPVAWSLDPAPPGVSPGVSHHNPAGRRGARCNPSALLSGQHPCVERRPAPELSIRGGAAMRDHGNMPKLDWLDRASVHKAKAQILHQEPVILRMPEGFAFRGLRGQPLPAGPGQRPVLRLRPAAPVGQPGDGERYAGSQPDRRGLPGEPLACRRRHRGTALIVHD